jgi:hypothetical protein
LFGGRRAFRLGACGNLPKQFGKERVKLGDFDLVLPAANLHD